MKMKIYLSSEIPKTRTCPRCGRRIRLVKKLVGPQAGREWFWRHGWRVTCEPERGKDDQS